MGEFSELRARIHDENRQVVERRVYAVTGQHLPEEQIDEMIETGAYYSSPCCRWGQTSAPAVPRRQPAVVCEVHRCGGQQPGLIACWVGGSVKCQAGVPHVAHVFELCTHAGNIYQGDDESCICHNICVLRA